MPSPTPPQKPALAPRPHPAQRANIGSPLKYSAPRFPPSYPKPHTNTTNPASSGGGTARVGTPTEARRRKHAAYSLWYTVVRAVRPRLGGGTGSVARDMQVVNFHPARWCGLFQMQCGAVLCCTYWVRCWDCIAWDSRSGAYCARLLLTCLWIGSEENREIVQVQHNEDWYAQYPRSTRKDSMQPPFRFSAGGV